MKELDEKIWKKFDVFGENGFFAYCHNQQQYR